MFKVYIFKLYHNYIQDSTRIRTKIYKKTPI